MNTYHIQYTTDESSILTLGLNVNADTYSEALTILNKSFGIKDKQIIYIVCKNHSYNS